MKINILTLFPEVFSFLNYSIVKRAQEKKIVKINIYNIRDYAEDKHKIVDDLPFGGGPGMILKIEPIYNAIKSLKIHKNIIFVTPQGEMFNQEKAYKLSLENELTFISGHYEGIDERIREFLVTQEISIGKYILTGGELPILVIIDAVVRLIPNVLGNNASLAEETFVEGMMEYPQYTRPRVFRGMKVPEVLFSGNHQEIKKWRKEKSKEKTFLYKIKEEENK